jgi:hypothetical protein
MELVVLVAHGDPPQQFVGALEAVIGTPEQG